MNSFRKLGTLRRWKVLINTLFNDTCLKDAIIARLKFKRVVQRMLHHTYLKQVTTRVDRHQLVKEAKNTFISFLPWGRAGIKIV